MVLIMPTNHESRITNHELQGRSNHAESLVVAYWCFVGILVSLGVALVVRGVESLLPLLGGWL